MLLKKPSLNFWAGIIFFVALLAAWGLDLSVAALNTGALMTNGFRTLDPMVSYHINLYLLVLCIWSAFLLHTLRGDWR